MAVQHCRRKLGTGIGRRKGMNIRIEPSQDLQTEIDVRICMERRGRALRAERSMTKTSIKQIGSSLFIFFHFCLLHPHPSSLGKSSYDTPDLPENSAPKFQSLARSLAGCSPFLPSLLRTNATNMQGAQSILFQAFLLLSQTP